MPDELKGKVAIVTGGSRGIGRAIALRLGELGISVVVNYASSADAAEETCLAVQNAGGKAVAVQADLSSVKEVEHLFDRTIEHFGKLEILINNAGIAVFKKIADFTEAEFDSVFNLNVKGLFFCCQQAANRMNDGGKIINISSTVTRVMMANYGAYGASKGAVEQITRVLARELGPRNISVNAISPGPVDTELFREGKSEQQIQALAEMSSFGRLGTPEDIADAVTMLLGEQSRWVTGQNLCANGGMA